MCSLEKYSLLFPFVKKNQITLNFYKHNFSDKFFVFNEFITVLPVRFILQLFFNYCIEYTLSVVSALFYYTVQNIFQTQKKPQTVTKSVELFNIVTKTAETRKKQLQVHSK